MTTPANEASEMANDRLDGDAVVAKYLAGSSDDLVDVCMQVYSRACKYGTEGQHKSAMAYASELKRRLAQPANVAASEAVTTVVGTINLTDLAAFFRDSAWLKTRSADQVRAFAAESLDKLASCGVPHATPHPLAGEQAGAVETEWMVCTHCGQAATRKFFLECCNKQGGMRCPCSPTHLGSWTRLHVPYGFQIVAQQPQASWRADQFDPAWCPDCSEPWPSHKPNCIVPLRASSPASVPAPPTCEHGTPLTDTACPECPRIGVPAPSAVTDGEAVIALRGYQQNPKYRPDSGEIGSMKDALTDFLRARATPADDDEDKCDVCGDLVRFGDRHPNCATPADAGDLEARVSRLENPPKTITLGEVIDSDQLPIAHDIGMQCWCEKCQGKNLESPDNGLRETSAYRPFTFDEAKEIWRKVDRGGDPIDKWGRLAFELQERGAVIPTKAGEGK